MSRLCSAGEENCWPRLVWRIAGIVPGPLVGGELLPQAKQFKYLRVLLKSDGKMECEMNRRFEARSAVLQVLRYSTEKGAQQEGEALDIPVHLHATLPHCFKLWVVTERMRSWIQAAEMRFLKRASWCDSSNSLGCLLGTSPWRFSKHDQNQRRPPDRPKTCSRNYASHLAWEYLRVPQEAGKHCRGEGCMETPTKSFEFVFKSI